MQLVFLFKHLYEFFLKKKCNYNFILIRLVSNFKSQILTCIMFKVYSLAAIILKQTVEVLTFLLF